MSEVLELAQFIGLDDEPPPLSPDQKLAMVSTVEETGNIKDAAVLERIPPDDLALARRQDPDFNKVLIQAAARVRTRLRKRIFNLAFEDQQIPIVGGKHKDKVIAWEPRTNDRMIELAAKLLLGDELTHHVKSTSINANLDARFSGHVDLTRLTFQEQKELRGYLHRTLEHDTKDS